jgi:hypothetical protein
MFDSALAFDRYRLEVVKSWPDGQEKSAIMAAIECALRRHEGEGKDRAVAVPRPARLNVAIPTDY